MNTLKNVSGSFVALALLLAGVLMVLFSLLAIGGYYADGPTAKNVFVEIFLPTGLLFIVGVVLIWLSRIIFRDISGKKQQ